MFYFKMKIFLFVILFLFLTSSSNAIDIIEVSKQYGNFLTFSTSSARFDEDQDREINRITDIISSIIRNDMSTTVFIKEKGSMTYKMESGILDLKRYKYENIMYNLNINIYRKVGEDKTFIIEAKLYDVASETIIFEKRYSFVEKNTRKVAHVVSDFIYYSMTGENGWFQAKILFSSSDIIKTKKSYKGLYIIDQDGYGERQLIGGEKIITSPIYDKNQKKIFYVDMTNGEPKINALNISDGLKVDVGIVYPDLEKESVTATPAPCNKSDCLLFTRIYSSGSEIYKATSYGLTKLTSGEINTSPSLSPDDLEFVYESNIDGRRNLYTSKTSFIGMRKLLTGNDGVYAEPTWSPNGEWIAFTKIKNGIFHLGIIKPDGTEETILHSSNILETPTWMPNSDAIIVSEKKSSSSKSILRVMSLEGRIIRSIITSVGAVSPSIFFAG